MRDAKYAMSFDFAECVYVFFLLLRPHPISTLFPYTTLFRSARFGWDRACRGRTRGGHPRRGPRRMTSASSDRKSTRLNSSHVKISYAVFCLKKKKRADAPGRRYGRQTAGRYPVRRSEIGEPL